MTKYIFYNYAPFYSGISVSIEHLMHSSNATQRRDIMSMFTGDHVETNWKMSASFAVHTVETTCQQCKYRALGNKHTDSFLVWLWNSWSCRCGQQNGVKLHQQDPGSCSCQSSLNCWLSGSCSGFPPGRLDCFEVACMYSMCVTFRDVRARSPRCLYCSPYRCSPPSDIWQNLETLGGKERTLMFLDTKTYVKVF